MAAANSAPVWRVRRRHWHAHCVARRHKTGIGTSDAFLGFDQGHAGPASRREFRGRGAVAAHQSLHHAPAHPGPGAGDRDHPVRTPRRPVGADGAAPGVLAVGPGDGGGVRPVRATIRPLAPRRDHPRDHAGHLRQPPGARSGTVAAGPAGHPAGADDRTAFRRPRPRPDRSRDPPGPALARHQRIEAPGDHAVRTVRVVRLFQDARAR